MFVVGWAPTKACRRAVLFGLKGYRFVVRDRGVHSVARLDYNGISVRLVEMGTLFTRVSTVMNLSKITKRLVSGTLSAFMLVSMLSPSLASAQLLGGFRTTTVIVTTSVIGTVPGTGIYVSQNDEDRTFDVDKSKNEKSVVQDTNGNELFTLTPKDDAKFQIRVNEATGAVEVRGVEGEMVASSGGQNIGEITNNSGLNVKQLADNKFSVTQVDANGVETVATYSKTLLDNGEYAVALDTVVKQKGGKSQSYTAAEVAAVTNSFNQAIVNTDGEPL